jgi:cytosine/adenosine deaminase-related metal-dependent hydrolase
MKIICAKYILPITSDPILDGAIAIEDGKIVAIGTKSEIVSRYPNATIEDHGDAVVMPGLVNAHAHLELTAMRGMLDEHDHDFPNWLLGVAKARVERFSEEELTSFAVSGAMEGARAGVTTFGDIGWMGRLGVEALKTVGLRGIVFQETPFSPDDRHAGEHFSVLRSNIDELSKSATSKVRIGISPHTPYTVSGALFKRIAEYSKSEGHPVSIHLAESAEEHRMMMTGESFFKPFLDREGLVWNAPGISATAFLRETGILKARPLFAHCVHLSDDDVAMLSDSGSRIAHCPKSNAKFGHGIAPIEKYLEAGIDIGLGSDSVASNNSIDLLEESRFALLFSRTLRDSSAAREFQREFLSPKKALEMATLGGASALGMESEIGSLEPGKFADLCVISLGHISQQPVHDIWNTLVFSTTARDVVATYVEGERV